jgi:hypothetical protein
MSISIYLQTFWKTIVLSSEVQEVLPSNTEQIPEWFNIQLSFSLCNTPFLCSYVPESFSRVSYVLIFVKCIVNSHARHIYIYYRSTFQARSQNCEKRLLGSSCPSVCLSVCLSVRMEQLGSHWMDFDKTIYLNLFRKYVKIIQVSFKCDKHKEYCKWRHFHIYENILLNLS